jgi:2-amino-4-hydroxy-6-hydroxymethyldihydropteridine diphosphokinase
MARVFLSLGSNVGDRLQSLRQAVAHLRAMPDVTFLDASTLYRTEPWEAAPGQRLDEADWYWNCAVAIETSLQPLVLLERLHEVEAEAGRVRGGGTPEDSRYEPRPLDLDILLYDDLVLSGSDRLHVPHLFLHERRFVLRPLAELAPEVEHPVLYQTIQELLQALDDDHRVTPLHLPPRWFDS